MNLQEFTNIRTECPMCGTSLITKFISDRKQKNRIIDNRYVAVLVMRGMRSCEPDYEVGYSFGMDDNSLSIEFYNEWDMSKSASNYMVKIFKDFHKNISTAKFRFIRTCGFCFKYELRSQPINLDLKEASYSSIELSTESFVFTTQTNEGYKFARLDNHVEWNVSDLWWWRDEHDYKLEWPLKSTTSHRFALPYIPFLSKEETNERLGKLILFS